MDKEVLLVEDRMGRKDQYCHIDVKNYSELFDVCTGTYFDKLKLDLENSKYDELDKYKCLMFHESSLSTNEKKALKDYCKRASKPLVFFSGNVSKASFKEIGFPFLTINAMQFYREGLLYFLSEYKNSSTVNLLMLQYGEKWELSTLLNFRNALNEKVEQQKKMGGVVSFLKKEINQFIMDNLNIIFEEGVDRMTFDSMHVEMFVKKVDELIYKKV